MEARLHALAESLRQERSRPAAQRSTGAEDAALDGAIEKVARARTMLVQGQQRAAADLLGQVAHLAVDSWSYSSPLSSEVVSCSQALARS